MEKTQQTSRQKNVSWSDGADGLDLGCSISKTLWVGKNSKELHTSFDNVHKLLVPETYWIGQKSRLVLDANKRQVGGILVQHASNRVNGVAEYVAVLKASFSEQRSVASYTSVSIGCRELLHLFLHHSVASDSFLIANYHSNASESISLEKTPSANDYKKSKICIFSKH
nr:unnamed protein product [Callosobruchus chinensis]